MDNRSQASSSTEALYWITLSTVTSYVIFTQRKTVRYQGTAAELRERYKKARRHNLLFGWWGFPFGLGWTPMILASNAQAMKKLEELVGSGTGSLVDNARHRGNC